MNNDLQVKLAFDSLFLTIEKLYNLRKKNLVSFEDSKKIINKLESIDYVFQSFF